MQNLPVEGDWESVDSLDPGFGPGGATSRRRSILVSGAVEVMQPKDGTEGMADDGETGLTARFNGIHFKTDCFQPWLKLRIQRVR